MAYTSINTLTLLPGQPWTSAKALAVYNNPTEIAKLSLDSPVNEAAWHPYDMVNIGDTGDGVIYDFAVDGGLATITTPDFVDGYEYSFWARNLNSGGTFPVSVALFFETGAVYSPAVEIFATSSSEKGFRADVLSPRAVSKAHAFSVRFGYTAGAGTGAQVIPVYSGVAQKILRARFTTTVALSAGVITMFKRRDVTSG